MTADVLITSLPGKVIEYILQDDNMILSDVVRFALTCKHLYRVVTTSNKLWRTKFFQSWPYLKEIYEKAGIKVQNWLEEVQASSEARKKLLPYLSKMSAKHYKKFSQSISDFKDFDPLFRPEEGAHPLACHFLMDELITLIERPVIISDLTHKYYAYGAVRYLTQYYLTQEWRKFIALPPNDKGFSYSFFVWK